MKEIKPLTRHDVGALPRIALAIENVFSIFFSLNPIFGDSSSHLVIVISENYPERL